MSEQVEDKDSWYTDDEDWNKFFDDILDEIDDDNTKLSIVTNPVYKGLVELDYMLDKAVNTVDKAFDGFDNLKIAGEKYAQEKIDKACEQISDKINKSLEDKKKVVCKTLKIKYKKALELIEFLKPFVDLLTLDISLDTIVNAVKKIIEVFVGPYIKPYEKAIKFINEMVTQVTPLIQNISKNTQKLMDSPDRAKDKIRNINPNLNLNKLKIDFTPPNIQDIIG